MHVSHKQNKMKCNAIIHIGISHNINKLTEHCYFNVDKLRICVCVCVFVIYLFLDHVTHYFDEKFYFRDLPNLNIIYLLKFYWRLNHCYLELDRKGVCSQSLTNRLFLLFVKHWCFLSYCCCQCFVKAIQQLILS